MIYWTKRLFNVRSSNARGDIEVVNNKSSSAGGAREAVDSKNSRDHPLSLL